jgi:peptidoglycan hydrolase-like protein with peptidoglycan-binding domain
MLNVFDRGIDFADAQVGLNDIKRQGAKFIIRYSAGAASAEGHPSHNAVKWKLCGLDEIHNTVAAGLYFFANSEWTVDRVTQGYAAGHEDGVADLAFWKARGLNPGSAVYYSWDKSQPDPSKYPGLRDYLRGVADAFSGYYEVGLYAGDVAIEVMMNSGVIEFGWLAMSESWSGPLHFVYKPGVNWLQSAKAIIGQTRAHILQNGNSWYGDGADENVILHIPAGSHLTATGSASTPLPKVTRPAPGIPLAFPLPNGYFFGPKDGPANSVSGYYGRGFNGLHDFEWFQEWALQLIRRGWSIGVGKKYLNQYGNNGKYGAEYKALIEAFQHDQHLTVDGELGVMTWNAAYQNPIT